MVEAFETANEKFAEGDYSGAVKYFDKALGDVSDSQKYVVHSNKGAALMNLGKVQEAIESFDEALSDSPDHVESLHNKGVALSALRKFKEAVKCFDKAISASPDFFASHCGKSEALSSLEKFDEAVEAAQDAIAVDASQPVAYADLGFAYLKLHKFGKAVSAYKKGIDEGDETAETKRLLGIALSEQALEKEEEGDIDGAIEMYSKSLKSYPDSQSYHNQGILYIRQNKEKKAIESFKKALKEDDHYFESLAALGALYAKADKVDQAMEYLEAAVTVRPDSTETHYNLGLVYLKAEKDGHAKKQFELVLKAEPDNPDVAKALQLLSKEGIKVRSKDVTEKRGVTAASRSYTRDIKGGKSSKRKGSGKINFYKLKELQTPPFPDDVDPARRQDHLSDKDFKKLFQCSRDEFDAKPQWKQVMEKKKHNLF